MHLPKEKILFKSPFRSDLETLLHFAEKALNDRAAVWSPFISEQLIEEVYKVPISIIKNETNFNIITGFKYNQIKKELIK